MYDPPSFFPPVTTSGANMGEEPPTKRRRTATGAACDCRVVCSIGCLAKYTVTTGSERRIDVEKPWFPVNQC